METGYAKNAGSGALNTSTVTARERGGGELSDLLLAASQRMEHCMGLVNSLNDRLAPVCRNEPPATKPSAVPQERLICTEAGSRLHDSIRAMNNMAEVLEGILNRLEV